MDMRVPTNLKSSIGQIGIIHGDKDILSFLNLDFLKLLIFIYR